MSTYRVLVEYEVQADGPSDAEEQVQMELDNSNYGDESGAVGLSDGVVVKVTKVSRKRRP